MVKKLALLIGHKTVFGLLAKRLLLESGIQEKRAAWRQISRNRFSFKLPFITCTMSEYFLFDPF